MKEEEGLGMVLLASSRSDTDHECYDFGQCVCLEPVLAFGTEQDTIVNSHCTRSRCSQKFNCLMSIPKNSTSKWYCLRKFENELSSRINQVLATEQV
jgi:hypothetical protein